MKRKYDASDYRDAIEETILFMNWDMIMAMFGLFQWTYQGKKPDRSEIEDACRKLLEHTINKCTGVFSSSMTGRFEATFMPKGNFDDFILTLSFVPDFHTVEGCSDCDE